MFKIKNIMNTKKGLTNMKVKVAILKVKIEQIKNLISLNNIKVWQNLNVIYEYKSDIKKEINWKELSNYNQSIAKILFLTLN